MPNQSFLDHIQDFIGETVTIFTTSGGESGAGFTGVIIGVNGCFVRLITCIGEAPGCALGNSCISPFRGNINNRCCCNNDRFRGLGSVTDIPIDRIAAFVHNAD